MKLLSFLLRGLTVALLVVLALPGCNESQKPNPLKRGGGDSKGSLYKRLGEEKAITKVVDDFIAIVAKDDRIRDVHKKHFLGDTTALKKKLIDQVGAATGGPQTYEGKNMKDAHKGMGITTADFDALLDDLRRALDQNKVAPADRDELLGMLQKMRDDVVEVK